jgi:hypothetical protein
MPSKNVFQTNLKTLLIWALLFFALSLVSPILSFSQDKPIGKIIGVIGTVEYLSGSYESVAEVKPGDVKQVSLEPWAKVTKQQPVYLKDQFRTSRRSRLKVLFSDNSLMALGPGSEISVQTYLHEPKNKLRQGVVNVKRGLTMYIVNKSQKNKKSFLNIVTPTANVGARGTQGYVGVSPLQTLVANQVGAVATKNSDPNIKGQQVVASMMKNMIPAGKAPTPPTKLDIQTLNIFRDVVLARLGPSSKGKRGEKPMITVEEPESDEEEDEEESSEGDGGSGGSDDSGNSENTPQEGPGGGDSNTTMEFDASIMDILFEFSGGDDIDAATMEAFNNVYNPFDDTHSDSCSP